MTHQQTSGSISLDTGSLATAVVSALKPVLSELNANMIRLAGLGPGVPLSEEVTAVVLTHFMPCSGKLLAQYLAEAGYALVAVAHPALEAEAQRARLVSPKDAQSVREDEWFDPNRRV